MNTSQVIPPPAFSHPLDEGNHNLKVVSIDAATTNCCLPTPKTSDKVPLGEGVAESRGRLSGEAPEPLPTHLRLYRSYLRSNANALRKRMTKAETYLWKFVLRAGQMKGYTFNRQRPVLNYIADFMCKQLKLIIEVDGSLHDNPIVKKHDVFRQHELEACGFLVLRFRNEMVLHGIEAVRDAIAATIKEIESADSKRQRDEVY